MLSEQAMQYSLICVSTGPRMACFLFQGTKKRLIKTNAIMCLSTSNLLIYSVCFCRWRTTAYWGNILKTSGRIHLWMTSAFIINCIYQH